MPVVPHRHCIVCGKAIEPEKKFCSNECEETMKREQKRQRNFTLAMFGLLFILLLMMLLFSPR
ncbi:MAG: DUF2116 family Zn-ribbon domain-containing protein [Archaeoglobales archaeon]|nr:DUF2116 family Zn-ribbon domain-containing protein [Archaeoglobales archaeon]